MHVAYVNQDPGIAPDRAKGAAVHLAAMREAFRSLGAETEELDEPDGERLAEALAGAHARRPLDLIYERYALRRTAAARFAREHEVPHVVEVNAPLADEERRWRPGAAAAAPEAELLGDERLVLGGATRVIAVSRLVARYARERGARAVAVFPNGVDAARFRPRRPADPVRAALVPEGRVALGFHGRLRPWHGFERLVAAAARLVDEGLPVHLVVVGEGPFDAHLGALPAERVTRLAWIPHEELPPAVAAFDLLPLTYSPDEPCYFSPLKLAEAMASGVVPVVPRLGDLPEVVRDGRSGRVYDPAGGAALVDALRALVLDGAERRRLAEGARSAASRLDWRTIARYALEAARPPLPADASRPEEDAP